VRKVYLLLALLPSVAFAQQTSPFVPYTITEQQHQDFMKWLNEQPFKFSAPVIQQLNVWEQQAIVKAQAEAKEKADAAKKSEPPKKAEVPKKEPEKKK